MKIIRPLLATIAFGAFAVNVAIAERPGPAKRPPMTGTAKESIAARALEQVRKGIPPSLLERPGNGVVASPLERPKKGIAAAATGHARNRPQDVQAIGGPTRNAIGLRLKNEPTAGGMASVPAAAGVTTTANLSGANAPHVGHPSPERAIAHPVLPVIGGTASVHGVNAAPALVGQTAGIRGIINGTGLGRVGSGPAVVGGPSVKSASINGTGMRPKH